MTDEQKIIQRFYMFMEAGLLVKDADLLVSCFAKRFIGIGLGEQGFVRTEQDVRAVLKTGQKPDDDAHYSLEYDRIETVIHLESFASLCAEVTIVAQNRATGKVVKSKLLQSLTLIKEEDDWKICALHATTPAVTEESMEAYPLMFAEKTLQSMREKIGEAAYQAEEQFRQAVLADAVAFYIVNFTTNTFEKCQLNCDWCLAVTPGTPYQKFVEENIKLYLNEADTTGFLQQFSLDRVEKAFKENVSEISFEYMMQQPSGDYIWVSTVIRLITDIVSGNKKGIMYVKNIDQRKREEQLMRTRAHYDEMTGVYNKGMFTRLVSEQLNNSHGVFVMFDIDDFKDINDAFGHPAGDQVLTLVAQELQNEFPSPTLIGRMGGDEFSLFIPDLQLSRELEEQLEHLCMRMRHLQVPPYTALTITCSIGAAYAPRELPFSDSYKKADIALYRSKRNGKNQVSYA